MFRRRRTEADDERPLWTRDGRLEREPSAPVGYESPAALTGLADAHGEYSGQVRLERGVAVGEQAPANVELRELGDVRVHHWERVEAEESLGPRVREATADEREAKAAKHVVYRQADLERATEKIPAAAAAIEPLRTKEAAVKEERSELSLVERGLSLLSSWWRVQLIAVFAAVVDALTMAKPIRSAGLAEGVGRTALIVAVAAGIWVAVNALGLLAGLIGLSLKPRDRLRAAAVAFVLTLVALLAVFGLVGVARHDWTAHTNDAIQRFAEGRPRGALQLLDPAFLVAVQVAAALGAITCLALYVMAERGRELKADLHDAESARKEAEDELAAREAARDAAHKDVEAADVAINDMRADARAAAVERAVIREKYEAERAGERALAEAAVGRQEWRYRVIDKLYENGRCHLAQLPDVWYRRKRRPVQATSVDFEPDSSETQSLDDLAA